jgi:hypothetical protein
MHEWSYFVVLVARSKWICEIVMNWVFEIAIGSKGGREGYIYILSPCSGEGETLLISRDILNEDVILGQKWMISIYFSLYSQSQRTLKTHFVLFTLFHFRAKYHQRKKNIPQEKDFIFLWLKWDVSFDIQIKVHPHSITYIRGSVCYIIKHYTPTFKHQTSKVSSMCNHTRIYQR